MLEIQIVDKEMEFDSLRAEWGRLLQKSSSDTIFLTWEWASAWWKSYRNAKELYVLKVMKYRELVGIAPLYRRSFRILQMVDYKTLHLIGDSLLDAHSDSDYLDIIVKSGQEESVVNSIAIFLTKQKNDWDFLFLNDVPEISSNLQILRRFFEKTGYFWEEVRIPCTYVNLPSDWEDYMKSLKPRMRTKVRSLDRKLRKNFRVRFERCQKFSEIKAKLNSMFDLHQQRWQLKNHKGTFSFDAKKKFYEEVSNLFLARKWLQFYSLLVNDQYVAHQFCLEYNNNIFVLQEGFDPEWAKHGVGNVLRAFVFRDCIERKISTYDFLGGVSRHKLSWAGDVKGSIRATVGYSNLKNRIFIELQKAVALAKERIKNFLSESTVIYLKKIKNKIC